MRRVVNHLNCSDYASVTLQTKQAFRTSTNNWGFGICPAQCHAFGVVQGAMLELMHARWSPNLTPLEASEALVLLCVSSQGVDVVIEARDRRRELAYPRVNATAAGLSPKMFGGLPSRKTRLKVEARDAELRLGSDKASRTLSRR